MASCVLSKSCPSRPSHVSHLPLPHLAFCCLRFTSSRGSVFLSCHLSSSHHLGSPCFLNALGLSSLSSSRSFSSELPAVVTAYDDSGDARRVLGRDDSALDAGLQSGKAGGSQYFQNIFNPESRAGGDRLEKNSSAQQPNTPSGSFEQNQSAANKASVTWREPTDYDFEIYASNSMEGWTPPPPPLPPFGNVFEDYWGEVIGEDYLPKKPERSSLLAYLDSLNAAKPEAGNSTTGSMPFRSSNLRRNRPFEATRANRPIKSENLRANRPIKEPKPIDSYWSADWSEGSYNITNKEVDKKTSSRSGGTLQGEGDEGGDAKPIERKIILGNSKLLGPLPGYGVEDAKPAERNTEGDRSAERNIILGNSTLLEPLPGYSDEDAKLVATLGKGHLSNSTGSDDLRDAKPAERNTVFNNSNLSSSIGRDGKLSEPMPGYVAGGAELAERNTTFDQSDVSKTAVGNSAADVSLNSVPANEDGVSHAKPWSSSSVIESRHDDRGSNVRSDMDKRVSSREMEVDSTWGAKHVDNITTDTTAYNGERSRTMYSEPFGGGADYRPAEDKPAGGSPGVVTSGGKNVLADEPYSVRHEDNLLTVQQMDPAAGHNRSLDSRHLNVNTNIEAKPLGSVADSRGVERYVAAKPIEELTALKAEDTSGFAGSQGSLVTPAKPAVNGSVEAVRQLYEPKVRDVVLGTVVSANDQKLDLEIGAEYPGLMLSKDLRPFLDTNLDSRFLKLPSNDDNDKLEGFVVPLGKSLIVEDKTIYNGAKTSGSVVERGMVITAEVEGRTLGDGRAILSVRPPARRVAWHRVKQLMQMAGAFDIQITQWNDGGLLSYVEGLRAFLPRSELVQRPESAVSLKEYVGKVLTVSIARVEEQAANIVISELKAWTRKYLRLGTVHDAIVLKVYPFGMQVEVNNTRVRGLVHVSNMSKEYVKKGTDLFTEGEKVRVMLIRGRDSQQIAFSIADLESERGLIFRDKERVFREAEEMARRFQESLSGEDQQIFGQEVWDTELEFQEPVIANMNWLHL